MPARRRSSLLLSAAVAASLLFTPTAAPAWNARGHMTVSAVAWANMNERARQRAIELLRLNPDFSSWIEDVPAADRDRIAFMQASTWPDDLRSRVCSSGPNCIRDDRYTPPDAEADQNIGYRDRRLRRYWHFKDLGFSIDNTPVEEPFRVNAATQIDAFSRSLTDASLNDEAKSFNLTWLLHIVGDVHQPLHATARFSAASRHGDAGGNDVIVCSPPPAQCETRNRPKTLHSFWDNAIGTSSSAASAARKADELLEQLRRPQSALSRSVSRFGVEDPPAEWFEEGRRLSQRYVYVAPIGPGNGPFFITPDYRENAGSIAEQRVALAGLRLARLLNDLLS